MGRRLAMLTICLVMATACALNDRPTLSPTKMAEFWQEPTDLAQRDLLNGPGGAALAPNPNDTFTLLKADPRGFSPGLDVKDDRNQEWSVKLGPEARTEVVISRIVWAMGYHQPAVYYVPRFTYTDKGSEKTEGPARFRLEPSSQKADGEWSWRNNAFLDTQPFAGLFVLMTVVNNWDLKSQQNTVYVTKGKDALSIGTSSRISALHSARPVGCCPATAMTSKRSNRNRSSRASQAIA